MASHLDPVCGMQVEETQEALKTEYAGSVYYFCSESCRAAFEKEPQAYAVQPNVRPTSSSR